MTLDIIFLLGGLGLFALAALAALAADRL